MKLFEKIPASFFSVLASPNRELYWTALVTLHHLLEYDLNIPVEDYCIALGDTLSDMELTAEDALDEEEQRLGSLTVRSGGSFTGSNAPVGWIPNIGTAPLRRSLRRGIMPIR